MESWWRNCNQHMKRGLLHYPCAHKGKFDQWCLALVWANIFWEPGSNGPSCRVATSTDKYWTLACSWDTNTQISQLECLCVHYFLFTQTNGVPLLKLYKTSWKLLHLLDNSLLVATEEKHSSEASFLWVNLRCIPSGLKLLHMGAFCEYSHVSTALETHTLWGRSLLKQGTVMWLS